MIDPLSAASLAGNIIGFVDFSTRALSKARDLYGSASGATEENEELESIARHVKEYADKTRQRPSGASMRFDGEAVLANLSRQCVLVADELLTILDSLKVQGDASARKSAVQAVRTLWKQDRLDGLQQRLDRISRALIDAMSMEQLHEINRQLRNMAVENTRLEANRTTEIEGLRRDFNTAIEEIQDAKCDERVPTAWLVLADSARLGQSIFAEQVVLQCLRFSSIDSRKDLISTEHSKTFSWIFEDSSIKLVDWLKQENGLYWVSGKPGSGKSTLMKFLAAQKYTKRCLEEWAGDKKLVIASFFFWKASTHTSQKSQRGLLRTILYQILRQCPALIHAAYCDQWIAMTSDSRVLKESRDELLTIPALLNTLRKISTLTESDTRFCLFIDGLDEYDGRPADIIQLIDILKSCSNIKTCVSSRPWNDFEDCFGVDSPYKLYVENYTREDIKRYVNDTLGKHPRFEELRKDPTAPRLTSSIVHQADGVFLWVFLVVQSLLDGLTNSDRIKDLQDRVNETPNDLKDYFKAMLFSTENRYRAQTAKMFSVAANQENELPLMAYWVIDQEGSKHLDFLSYPAGRPTNDVLKARFENMSRRLKVLSKGLLEVGEAEYKEAQANPESRLLFDHPVKFLHRTVYDYLQTPEASLMLQIWRGDTFNVNWEITTTLAALMRMAPPKHFSFTSPDTLLEGFMAFFGHYVPKMDLDPAFREELISMLDQLQESIAPALNEYKDTIYEELGERFGVVFLSKASKESIRSDIFVLSLSTAAGALGFVKHKFTKDPELARVITSTICSLYLTVERIHEQVNTGTDNEYAMAMLELLLANGADPNAIVEDQTEWEIILESLKYNHIRRLECFNAIKVLLRYGADFERRLLWDPEKTARGFLQETYDSDHFAILEDTVKRRESKLKKIEKISRKVQQLRLFVRSKR